MLNGTKCSEASRRFFASLRMTVYARAEYSFMESYLKAARNTKTFCKRTLILTSIQIQESGLIFVGVACALRLKIRRYIKCVTRSANAPYGYLTF